jgi:tetratricopeptide (TPR) repeat protein
MSLLIKALDKAQSAKKNPPNTSNTEPELSLSPAPVNNSSASDVASAQSAANVFASKRIEPLNDKSYAALILGVGLLTLLGLGAYYYVQLNQLSDSSNVLPVAQAVMQPPPVVETPVTDTPATDTPVTEAAIATQQISEPPIATPNLPAESLANALPATPAAPTSSSEALPEPQAFELKQPIIIAENKKPANKLPANKTMFKAPVEPAPALDDSEPANTTESTLDSNEQVITPTSGKKSSRSKKSLADKAIASESASISVTKNQAPPVINNTLMSAYEAYNAGNDNEALALYKQVLRSDVRNVDALLGLGAIAQRQGRAADANGWYGKVLEVEPRNTLAQSAMLDSPTRGGGQADPQADESRIKNMLAKQPEDPNLHAALGSLYADQNQWPAAQQAYFDAYRLHASADNALNLAVSLDQMGKSKLALPYYQRALEQATDASGIDRASLEDRIKAIQ